MHVMERPTRTARRHVAAWVLGLVLVGMFAAWWALARPALLPKATWGGAPSDLVIVTPCRRWEVQARKVEAMSYGWEPFASDPWHSGRVLVRRCVE